MIGVPIVSRRREPGGSASRADGDRRRGARPDDRERALLTSAMEGMPEALTRTSAFEVPGGVTSHEAVLPLSAVATSDHVRPPFRETSTSTSGTVEDGVHASGPGAPAVSTSPPFGVATVTVLGVAWGQVAGITSTPLTLLPTATSSIPSPFQSPDAMHLGSPGFTVSVVYPV